MTATVRLLDQFGPLQLRMAADRGPFTLFALVRLEGRLHWDVLAAAPWIDEDRLAALRYIAGHVQTLPPQTLRDISHIELIPSDDERIAQLARGKASLGELFDVPARYVHVLAIKKSRRAPKTRSRRPATKG
jgi:hypothetical protein